MVPPRRRLARAGLFGLAFTAFASSAGAGVVAFPSPEAGARLSPGSTVRVLWDHSERPSRRRREVELVLSLDGGRTFPVRLTRDLSPGTRAWLWRVPALPTVDARLGLRAGDGGEPDEESIELVSAPFEIVRESGAPLSSEPLRRGRGEWQTEHASPAGEPRAPDDFDADAPSEMQAADDAEPAADTPRAAAPGDPARIACAARNAHARPGPSLPSRPPLSADYPLRP